VGSGWGVEVGLRFLMAKPKYFRCLCVCGFGGFGRAAAASCVGVCSWHGHVRFIQQAAICQRGKPPAPQVPVHVSFGGGGRGAAASSVAAIVCIGLTSRTKERG
jgi:hypothetical protein